MPDKVTKTVWTRQARESLNAILDYRYKDIPSARKIVLSDIINSLQKLIFPLQFQEDDIYPQYRRIVVRDHKVLYKEQKGVVYVMNVVCAKSK